MDDTRFLEDYCQLYKEALFGKDITPQLTEMCNLVVECHRRENRVIFAGNGAGCLAKPGNTSATPAAIELFKKSRRVSLVTML